MNRKFGWHSGTVHAVDGLFRGDVTIQDDLIFGDVSAGVLGITGGIDMTETTSAVGIDMSGGTFATADIRLASTGVISSTTAFQLSLQDSTYLYSTSTIKDAERGIVSLYCESLGSAINTDAADRTAFLIRARMGSDAASVTTGRNAHALDVLMDCNADYAVTTNLRNADVRGARIQAYGHNNVSGMVVGAYIASQVKGDFAFGGQVQEGKSFAGAVGLEVRLETTGSGTVTMTSTGGGTQQGIALLVSTRIANAWTGSVTGIWIEKPYEGTNNISGTSRGIYFATDGLYNGATDFDIGIDLGDECVTGIDIGDCTTGINVTGTASSAGILMSASNKIAFYDTDMYMYASADGHLNIVADDTLTLSSPGHGSIVFGGETDWGTGATGHLIDGSGADWCTQTVARVSSGALDAACAAAYHALSVTAATHSTASSFFGTWTELYIADDADLSGAANVAAVWGQIEAGTNVTLSDDGDYTAGGYFNVIAGSTLTIATGHSVSGVRSQAEIGAVSNNGTLAAFHALKNGGVDWAYGVYLADCGTGVKVAACTKAFEADAVACATGAYGFSVQSTLTGASNGAAAYFQTTIDGTPTGDIYAVGAWMNVTIAPVANEYRALDVGVWTSDSIDNAGATYIGLAIDMSINDGGGVASKVYPMRFNCEQTGHTPDHWFRAANNEAIAFSGSTANNADQYGTISILLNATEKFIRVYDT